MQGQLVCSWSTATRVWAGSLPRLASRSRPDARGWQPSRCTRPWTWRAGCPRWRERWRREKGA